MIFAVSIESKQNENYGNKPNKGDWKNIKRLPMKKLKADGKYL
jgi:hypothetical protein